MSALKPCEETEIIELTGKFCRRIFRSDDGYCVYLYSTDNGTVTVVGTDLPEAAYPVTFSGCWIDSKFGRQFRADATVNDLPDTQRDITDFLCSLRIGIGRAKSKKLLKQIGPERFWETLRNNPKEFCAVPGITPVILERLKAAMVCYEIRKDLIAFFHGELTLTGAQYSKILACFPDKTIILSSVQENPYSLIRANYGFLELDQFCSRRHLFQPWDGRRLAAAALQALRDGQRQCHVGLPQDVLIGQMQCLLSKHGAVSSSDCASFLEDIRTEQGVVYSNGLFYTSQSYSEETAIIQKLLELLHIPPERNKETELKKHLERYEKKTNIILSDEQRQAVIMAVTNSVSIVTGGPGTGKSTILDAVLYCWSKLHSKNANNILLMAPTGRASCRMTETTEKPAYTVHSALQLGIARNDDSQEGYTSVNSTMADLIVIDESSMLDQSVTAAIFRAIQGPYPHLMFVGDPDQLPSVGYGNILADLLRSDRVPVCKLTTIYRQAEGNPIIINAQRIRDGIGELDWGQKTFRHYHHGSDESNMAAACELYRRCVRHYGIQNVALLSPYHNATALSTNRLNQCLQEIINPDLGQPSLQYKQLTFRMNDRVMQLQNEEEVSNGDIGTVVAVMPWADKDEPCLVVRFDTGAEVGYTHGTLGQLDLAYAMSVHKSQGAQYQTVIMVLPNYASSFLRRNILYTGITRAEKNVAIFGPNSTIQAAISNNRYDRRYSNLANRLIEAI